MADLLSVEVVQGKKELSNVGHCICFAEVLPLLEEVKQFTSFQAVCEGERRTFVRSG